MLPPAYRLRRSADFQRAVRRGRRGSAATTVIHVYAGSSTPRVGFVVSRAVGGAVVRNRVRRRLRDIVRARLDRLPAGAIVVRATSRAAEASHAELGADVDRCLKRLQESRRRP